MVLGASATWFGAILHNFRGRLAETILLVMGICAMHFTGMSAVTLVPDPTVGSAGSVIAPAMLAITIAAVALLLVSLGQVTAQVDQNRMRQRTAQTNRLRTYIAELEATKRQLENTSEGMRIALEKAAAANETKSAFLAAMSHELRTPLNAVIGFSDLVLSEPFGAIGDVRYKSYIGDISKSGSHLLSLINDILDLSRLETNRADIASERVSIREILSQAKRMVEVKARQALIDLSVETPETISDVRGDASRLKQVFLNLVSNAIKFTPIGGSVSVSAEETDEGIVVTVTDTGIGIAEADISKALERFSQVDNRLARRYEGAGLGLPIAKQIVESHGGSLHVHSKVNAGTTVRVLLPQNRILPIQEAEAA
jgi:signal transduction histidine kinase